MKVCEVGGRCSGCPKILTPFESQKSEKQGALRGLLTDVFGEPVDILIPGELGLRDRVDLTLMESKLGLFDLEADGLVDLHTCPMMSPMLESWFKDFRKNLPAQIKKGSVRLRVSPSGLRGAWLDFANVDVKALLDDQVWLRELMKNAVVEIGQRRKTLIDVDGRLKLGEPKIHPWFETYLPETTPLFCHVGSFTQVGFQANRLLVETVMRKLEHSKAANWLELGSGIGNFTLPLAKMMKSVVAVELDVLAVESLKHNLKVARLKAEVLQKDYRRIDLSGDIEGVLCDPPRSGLGTFTEWLGSKSQVREVIYVSCFPESFLNDVRILKTQGFKLESLIGVDQFPQTNHCELVGRLTR